MSRSGVGLNELLGLTTRRIRAFVGLLAGFGYDEKDHTKGSEGWANCPEGCHSSRNANRQKCHSDRQKSEPECLMGLG